MISSILAILSGAMKAVTAWFRKAERDDHIQAGIDKQAVAEHEQNEGARERARLREEELRNNDDLSDRVHDAFHDPDFR